MALIPVPQSDQRYMAIIPVPQSDQRSMAPIPVPQSDQRSMVLYQLLSLIKDLWITSSSPSMVLYPGFQVGPTFLICSYFSLLFHENALLFLLFHSKMSLYPPQTLFVGGILFSRCPCVRPSVRPSVRASVRLSVRPSVTLCFLNNSKSHCWIFIKPCKHVHICKTNTLDKKVRARGQFY